MSVQPITDLSSPPFVPSISTPPSNQAVPVSPAAQAGWGISVQVQNVTRVIGGVTSQITTDDRVENSTPSGSIVTDYQIAATRVGSQNEAIVYSSDTPSVATVSATGFVSHVSVGKAKIRVQHGPTFVDVPLLFTQQNTLENRGYLSGATGSARLHAEQQVDTLLAGSDVATDMAIYTTQDHASPSYVRNASCWAQGLTGMTGISPWNSTGANKQAGAAITPRHITFAKHFQIGTGATVRFIDAAGAVVERTILAKESLPAADTTIALLDSDLPASIVPAKFLPATWEDYFPTGLQYIPALSLDQEEKALVSECRSSQSTLGMQIPTDAKRLEFYERIVGGDSGNPVFIVIGGELVIVATWLYGGVGTGPFLPYWRTEIEAAITSLGDFGHSLTDVDLSSFTDFS